MRYLIFHLNLPVPHVQLDVTITSHSIKLLTTTPSLISSSKLARINDQRWRVVKYYRDSLRSCEAKG
jgi:hypothetical protein